MYLKRLNGKLEVQEVEALPTSVAGEPAEKVQDEVLRNQKGFRYLY